MVAMWCSWLNNLITPINEFDIYIYTYLPQVLVIGVMFTNLTIFRPYILTINSKGLNIIRMGTVQDGWFMISFPRCWWYSLSASSYLRTSPTFPTYIYITPSFQASNVFSDLSDCLEVAKNTQTWVAPIQNGTIHQRPCT